MFSRPTVGLAKPSTARAKTSPITANWTRLAALALGVGAEVEDHRLAAPGRHERGDRRPLDPRQGLEHELGERHEGAGVAGRDRGAGPSLFDRIDREPHAGVAALTQHLRRLGVGADVIRRVLDHAPGRQLAPPPEQGGQSRLIAKQQESQARETLPRHVSACEHDLRRMIAAHGVESDGQAHGRRPLSQRRCPQPAQ